MTLAEFICALAENQNDLDQFNSGNQGQRQAVMSRYRLSQQDQDIVNKHIEKGDTTDFLDEYDENNCWTHEAMLVC